MADFLRGGVLGEREVGLPPNHPSLLGYMASPGLPPKHRAVAHTAGRRTLALCSAGQGWPGEPGGGSDGA